MIVLGIETSCDETSASLVTDKREILSNIILSQIDDHKPFGGIVPEIAARSHLDALQSIVARAFAEAQISPSDISGIAATAGPGLIGGVLVGSMMAKAMAFSLTKPFVAVNHLEGHALTVRLSNDVPFPYLLLLVSGGHTQLLIVENVGVYHALGATLDDAVGEAFDKTAKVMGLPYPGGPELEKLAKQGDPKSFLLPKPMVGRDNCDFSLSGLKTAVKRAWDNCENQHGQAANLAASFQRTIALILEDRCKRAIGLFKERYQTGHLVVAGGVAANELIRTTLQNLAEKNGMQFTAPPLTLCTDNAAMIAWAGLEHLRLGQASHLDHKPRPRWPLTEI